MVISYRHRFIFIKTKKTAGSSIEHYLFPYLGPDDICSGSSIDGTPSLNGVKKHKGHIGWRWIAQHKSQEWNDFFSFAVVRNPWDTVVSGYHWLRSHAISQGKEPAQFPDFAMWVRGAQPLTLDPWPLIADHDRPQVDQILRYENLQQEIQQIPVPYAGELLTTFKKRSSESRSHYRSFYTESSRERIAQVFGNVIAHFGYSF